MRIVLIWLVSILKNEVAVYHEVVKLHVACLTSHLYRLLNNASEVTVFNSNVVNILDLVQADDQYTIVTLLAGYILHVYLANSRLEATIADFLSLVVEINLQYCLTTLTNSNVAHVDILNQTTTAVVSLDSQYTLKVRRVHVAVLCIYILASTRNLRTDNYTTMTIFHLTVTDDDVFAWSVPKTSVVVASALDSNTVVASMEGTVLNKNVLACLWIAAVTIRTFVPNVYTIYGDVLREQWVDNPERRVGELYILDEDAIATIEVDKLWTQALSLTKTSFILRYTILSIFQQTCTATQVLCFLGNTFLEVELLSSTPWPPSFAATITVDGSLTCDSKVCLAIGVDTWRIVPAT